MSMNREIKFRAWCKQREEWIDIRRIFFNECESSYVEDYDGEIYFPERRDWALMQFTGLKDKNGVEIYEGDIIECFNDGLSEVLFRKGSFGTLTYTSRGVDFYTFNEVYGACEIIGNIYENPELLEVES